MTTTIVAPYPRTKAAHGEESLGGVASYTKNLVYGMPESVDLDVIALHDAPQPPRVEGLVHVRESSRDPARLREALLSARGDVVHLQFEQHLYGGPLENARLSQTLRELAKRKAVVMTLHQVPDLDRVDRQFLKDNGFPPLPFAARAWIRWLYRRYAAASRRLIVHQATFKERLATQYGVDPSKVQVIPHGIEDRSPVLPPKEAKAKLGLEGKVVALYFGYVTGYKGVDLLVEAVEKLPQGVRDGLRVVVAGKAPDRKLEKPAFRKAIEDLEARIGALAPLAQRKGFLDEPSLALHLAAADVVLFPYRTVFSASGPMSIAVGHGLPFLASDRFRGMGPEDETLFPLDADALSARLARCATDPAELARLRAASERMKAQALWPAVGRATASAYEEVRLAWRASS